MAVVDQLKSFQTGSTLIGNVNVYSSTKTVLPGVGKPFPSGSSLQKTTQDISKLSSKMNELSSFVNEAGVDGGNQPFNLITFAKQFTTKQAEQPESTTSTVTNLTPTASKLKQINKKIITNINQNYIKSGKLISLLETQVNNVLKQSGVSYSSLENGQIVTQPIQNDEVTKVLNNIQKILDSYVTTVNKYGHKIYNTDPILTINQFQKNFSLNKFVDFTYKVLSIAILALEIKIKIRKAQDAAAAANALLTVPPQPLVAARFVQSALELTTNEYKQMVDLNESFKLVDSAKKQIDFYGNLLEELKTQLSNVEETINSYFQTTTNKALQQVNNQLTGSTNQTTGSI